MLALLIATAALAAVSLGYLVLSLTRKDTLWMFYSLVALLIAGIVACLYGAASSS